MTDMHYDETPNGEGVLPSLSACHGIPLKKKMKNEMKKVKKGENEMGAIINHNFCVVRIL